MTIKTTLEATCNVSAIHITIRQIWAIGGFGLALGAIRIQENLRYNRPGKTRFRKLWLAPRNDPVVVEKMRSKKICKTRSRFNIINKYIRRNYCLL